MQNSLSSSCVLWVRPPSLTTSSLFIKSIILTLFFFSVHETAHWILTKIQGFRTDSIRKDEAIQASATGKIGPSNISVSQAGQTKPDYLIAIGQRPDDAGARSTDMLIGATAKVVSFADGESYPSFYASNPLIRKC